MISTIRIGEMDQRITIRTTAVSLNSYGEEIDGNNTDVTVFAKVEYLTQGKEEQTMQEVVYDKLKFTIRYYSTLSFTEKSSIIYDSNEYDIINIQKLGRNKFYQVIATRVH